MEQNHELTVQVTLEWTITKKEYEEAKAFIQELNWDWDEDPMSAVHFLNQIGWPKLRKRLINHVRVQSKRD